MSGDRYPSMDSDTRAAMRLRRESAGPGQYRIVIDGELDLHTAVELRAEVSALLEGRPPPTHVELDLAGVTFMDSLGLGTLVVGRRFCAERGVRYRVHNPSPFVSRLLQVSGLRDSLSGSDN